VLPALLNYYLPALIILYPAWRICRRAGFNPLVSLLLLVPLLGLLLLTLYLAFKEWPNEPGPRKADLP
jgi:hypothetical protein